MSLQQLPPAGDWIAELSNLDDATRLERLRQMVTEVKRQGGCGSLQTFNGLPCRRPPKIGYPVCLKHGERARQTVAKAERALAAARMPAIEWIMDALDQANADMCGACGFPKHGAKERRRIDSLAFKLLDRTGFGPRSTIDVRTPSEQGEFDLALLEPAELRHLETLVEAMDEFQTRVRARLAADQARVALEGAIEARALPPGQPEEA